MPKTLSYWDSCPECDSLSIKIEGEYKDPATQEQRVLLFCRNCGAEWEDWENEPR